MSTHDADNKPLSNPADRRTMTRDPNATGGPIVEDGTNKDGLTKTIAGTTHLTTNIDGKWYVCNTRGEPFDMTQGFTTESDAVAEAQRMNGTQPPQTEAERDAIRQQMQNPTENQSLGNRVPDTIGTHPQPVAPIAEPTTEREQTSKPDAGKQANTKPNAKR